MSIEGDVVEDLVVDQGAPEAERQSNPTNPITDPRPEADVEDKPAKPEVPEVPKGVQKRIDRAVREKYEAQARAKMLEERLSQLEQRAAPPPQQYARQPNDGEPTIDNFDNFDQYVAAKAEWIAKRQIESTLSEREKKFRAEHEAAERSKTVDSWNKRVIEATAEMPDFEDVIASSDVPMSIPMQQAIMESDVGTKLAYYLATNPDEATTIAGMSPIAAVRALGRIEERLGNPTVKKTTSAPPPFKASGAKASIKKDPNQMSDAEYAKWRKSAK